ncbi:MAG: response regulator [Gemmatimonadetes bacterium]|nr:response regulator [Gemmatimonadota bacterium]
MQGPPPHRSGERRPGAVILVVERDPHVRELEAFFLERAGFDVQLAEDGEQAEALLERLQPDILITEVLVPRLDGLHLCRRVKAARPETKVLVFSILAVSERAQEAGADAFLHKPLEEDALVATVARLLTLEQEAHP